MGTMHRHWHLAAILVVSFAATAHGQDGAPPDEEATPEPESGTSDDITEVPEEEVSPERADAQRRYAMAVERADAGNCELAIAEFEEIYRLLENPVVFFNMAVCYEELHRYDEALGAYQKYLNEAAPNADERGEVERALRRLEGFLGTIQVTANVPASVWIDDREAGESPGEFRVPAGSHVVELRAPGYESDQQEVVVASGRSAELSFTLEELAEEYEGLGSGYFWAASVATVLSLGATIAVGAKALQKNSEFSDLPVYESELREQGRSDLRRLSLTTDVLLGATALFGTATVIFGFLTDWGDGDDAPSARVSPTVGRGLAGLVLEGSF